VIQFGEYARGELPPPHPHAPYHEPCEEYVPGLEAKPWHCPDAFDWIAGLERHSGTIQQELAAVLAADALSFNGDSAMQTQVMGAGWSALRLQRMGEWNELNMARFPKTTALLMKLQVPTAMRGVMFARQAPHSRVAQHSDGRNFVLTAHLGLQVPPPEDGECWMTVAGERRTWEEGKCVVIDTSFAHETCNAGSSDRHVLIVDFWHPGLSEAEKQALKFVYELRYKYDSEIINNKT
jgi:aspartate beta-hydroxylase